MATPVITPDPTPAPGPELSLGGPSRIGGLSAESIARLNKVAAGVTGEAPAEPPAPKPAAPPAAKPAPATPPAKPAAAAKPEEKPAPTKPDAEGEKPAKAAPAQLREAYEKAQAKVAELEATYTATTAEKAAALTKLAKVEADFNAANERITKEFEPLKQQFVEQSKRLQEREEALRIKDFTATTEWHEKHVKPVIATQGNIQRLLRQLSVTDSNGNARAATMDDFHRVANIPYLNARGEAAKQLFGDGYASTELVRLSSELQFQLENQQEALKTAQLESQEWATRTQQKQTEEQNKFRANVQAKVQTYVPKLAEGDAEEAAAFAEGQKLTELIANGDPRLSADEVADTVAKAHGRIASNPVLELRLKRKDARIAELEAELAAYHGSEPPVETRRGGEAPSAGEVTGRNTEERLKKTLLDKAVTIARSGR